MATFAYYTGWCKQQILTLRWNQVDLNARTVRLEPGTTKNDKGRLIVLDGDRRRFAPGERGRELVSLFLTLP